MIAPWLWYTPALCVRSTFWLQHECRGNNVTSCTVYNGGNEEEKESGRDANADKESAVAIISWNEWLFSTASLVDAAHIKVARRVHLPAHAS